MAELRAPKGANKKRRIVGRGNGGRGGTCGRGDKGQNSRAGGGVRPGFEGGQMPLYRRIARRGFSNARFKNKYSILNVSDLNKNFENGETVNMKSLLEKKLIKESQKLVKILGDGKLEKKLVVEMDAVSAGAKKKIEEAGGEVKVKEEGNNGE
ncbi:MAG: 50S ribosomal protein L15 [Spirochaetales bacterium]|nr:50S ribosomal protein L15 [Spirochaetales bacterium]